MKIATSSIDRNAMTLEDYTTKYEKTLRGVEQTFRDRAYKMLVIANPENGEGFFQLLYNYDWSKKGLVALTKEKLYTLAISRLSQGRYEILSLKFSSRSLLAYIYRSNCVGKERYFTCL